MDIRWRKISAQVEQEFAEGVWNQTILPNRIDKVMWREHFTRLRNNAEAGWGKKFNEASSLQEWERFQRIEANLRDFAAHKQHRIIEEMRALKAKGLSRADWDKEAARILKRHNKNWLKTELQATTAAAQAAESWAVFESRAYLYPNLRYETAGDERVRESHKVLDNVVKPLNDPFWDVYYPPNGWNCRCKVVQTDAPVSQVVTPDFVPAKGFSGNVGKTGKLFSDDHPYFNVPALDRETLQDQAKALHAGISREEVRDWSKGNLVNSFSETYQGMPQAATITGGEVKTITGKPHQQAAWRNQLLYVLKLITGEKLRYIGVAPDRGKHQGVLNWYYYLLELGEEKYYFNFWRRLNDDGVERIGLPAITDTAPDFAGP